MKKTEHYTLAEHKARFRKDGHLKKWFAIQVGVIPTSKPYREVKETQPRRSGDSKYQTEVGGHQQSGHA